MTSTPSDELKAQHRADGETLTKGSPDLLAAARRAHTLLVNLEVDSGDYYRETGWLGAAIKAAQADSSRPTSSRRSVLEEAAREIERYSEGLIVDYQAVCGWLAERIRALAEEE